MLGVENHLIRDERESGNVFRRKKPRRVITRLVLILFVASVGLLGWWSWASGPYSSTGNGEKITITPGTTASILGEELQNKHLIRSALMFKIFIHFKEPNFKLYIGDYEISPKMTPEEIIKRFVKGEVIVSNNLVTIPEGLTTEQIIDLLVQKGIGSKESFTKVVTDDEFSYSFLKGAPSGIHRLEGYLFPNTYAIDPKTSPHAVIDMLLKQFAKELTPEVLKDLEAANLTVQKWVTLSSLVEKEAVQESDRELIAAVFLNRLKINQPLQSCATIQFLLGTPKAKLYEKDLKIPSPYNTYLHVGLPPGPIASPGHASLQAALHPAVTDYKYFVAKSDGYHAFAKTYSEHLQNVKLYE